MPQDLNGRVAVITGGGSGLGRGAALAFAKQGAKLVLADIDLTGAEETARLTRELGANAVAVECDVGQADAFTKLRAATLEQFGDCDIIVNNAGVSIGGRPEDIPVSEWERVLNINLMSAVRSLEAFLRGFLERGAGHIVNVASTAPLSPYAYDRAPYAASKAALVSLSESLALYCRPRGVGVTVFCPGPMKTSIGKRTAKWGEPIAPRGPGPEYPFLSLEQAGQMLVDAVIENRFAGFTHPQIMEAMARRAAADIAAEEDARRGG
jgi:NAD(P)-dependent dehydrogenase (short-subunit alcohol dehydrogenase family)